MKTKPLATIPEQPVIVNGGIYISGKISIYKFLGGFHLEQTCPEGCEHNMSVTPEQARSLIKELETLLKQNGATR